MDTIDRIFEKLKEKGITAKTLAEEIGVSTGNISDWKSRRSKPSLDVITRISDVLCVSIDYLVNGEEYGIQLDDEQIGLLEQWAQLDAAGRTIVKAKIIEELRRLEK